MNVTPDSFSDGGQHLDADAAIAHGLALVAAGAEVLDVGGESTRPGAEPVALDTELRRILPVVTALAHDAGVPVSVDTSKAGVAEAAIAAGAMIVNDVTAGLGDPSMVSVVADAGAGFVAMHMRGEPRTMQEDTHYDDVVVEVGNFLAERVDALVACGVSLEAIAVDPGIGFAKTGAHNLEILARLEELVARVDAPVMVGASRKAFLGAVLAQARHVDAAAFPPAARDDATLAAVMWAADHGASLLRVHDVGPAVHAVGLLRAIEALDAEAVA
ncbi:MAG: dihydropteroate synthase [Acidimicrobiia bacterium]